VRPAGGWFDGLLIAGFVAITWALAAGGLFRIDLAVRNWCDDHQPGWTHWIAWVFNHLGQGTPLTGLCLVIALVLGWRARSVRPVLMVVAAFVLTFGTLTPLKDLTDRAAPHSPALDAVRFGSGGVSYPSGHLANAIVWYGVLAALLAPWLTDAWRRTIRVAPPAILFITTVYLGYHWLTDTVAGLLLGLLLGRIMQRIPWHELPPQRPPITGHAEPAIAPAAEQAGTRAPAGTRTPATSEAAVRESAAPEPVMPRLATPEQATPEPASPEPPAG
jgi:membrane-associated phospholipid phosphatase